MALKKKKQEVNEISPAFQNADVGSLLYGPDYYLAKAGQSAALTGGATSEAITVPGVESTDIAIGTLAVNSGSVAIAKLECTANTITLHCTSTIPASAKLNYAIYRAFAE
jgi:hypothetical protein